MINASAYLCLFDDFDLLGPALETIVDRVDEIVVVDGAYRWMLPYFTKMNRDPTRSVSQVYDVLSKFGSKVKLINGIWDNELEKRMAGYSGCSQKFRYRVDSDEIQFFDEGAEQRFFKSGCAVGQMYMPAYIAPGLIEGEAHAQLPRQSFLFDSAKVADHEHLSYLWLVLPAWERAKLKDIDRNLVFGEALAFTAHLTGWRPPTSSISRARFYVMNYMRQYGLPSWMDEAAELRTITNFESVFDKLSPTEFNEILCGSSIVTGVSVNPVICRKTVLSHDQEARFSYLYGHFLDQLALMNAELTASWRTIARGVDYQLDATSESSVPLTANNELLLEFSDQIANIKVVVTSYYSDAAPNDEKELSVTFEGYLARVKVPSLCIRNDRLRRTLTITVWNKSQDHIFKFRIQMA
jgi:hypothetical protein